MPKLSIVRFSSLLMVAGLFFVVVAGCVTPKLTTTCLTPAGSSEAARLKRVGVIPFTGKNGAQVAAELETFLAEIRVNDEQYFTLVERNRMDDLKHEVRYASAVEGKVVDPSTAAKLGRMVGAQGIYTGTVSVNSCTDAPFKVGKTRCTKWEKKRDKKGNIVDGDCAHWQNYSVDCTKRVAQLSFSVKLIEIESATLKYSKQLDGEAVSSVCADQGDALETSEQLTRKAHTMAFAKLRKDLAPSSVEIKLSFMTSDAGIVNDEAKKKFKSAIAFAKANRLDRACELWGELAVTEEKSPGIVYGIGLCAEMSGDLDRALTHYNRADRLLDKPDPTIGAALVRVRETQARQKKLEKQTVKEEVPTQQKKKK